MKMYFIYVDIKSFILDTSVIINTIYFVYLIAAKYDP